MQTNMNPYLLQFIILAIYALPCLLLGFKNSPGGGGGYQMGAILIFCLCAIIHLVITIGMMLSSKFNYHYLIAIILYLALSYIIITFLG